MADNMKVNDWVEIALYGLLAYEGARLTGNIAGAAIGPIGLRLATTMGGTPPVSQIAGLAILGALGLIEVTPQVAITARHGPLISTSPIILP